MIKINGKEFRNPQEQLAYNTEEIEKLKETIKDAYKTSSTLTSSSVSDTRANTNVPEGVKSAWLMTSDGLLFKITGNDGTTLLLTYYSDLKGPQGEQGEEGNPGTTAIDDNETSLDSTWSSSKIESEINGNVKANVLLDGTESLLSSIEIGGTKYKGVEKTFQHFIVIKDTSNYYFYVVIENNDNTSFDATSFKDYFSDNGFTDASTKIYTLGVISTHSGLNKAFGIYYNSVADILRYKDFNNNEASIVISTFNDKVITLN